MNLEIGLSGEEEVLTYEKNRLILLGREDLAKKIKWVSQDSDDYGFDIISYDINEVGDVTQKYIEVKSSKNQYDVDFFISKNELAISEEYGDKYVLFRVYDIESIKPKYYEIRGNLNEKLTLEPQCFKARVKSE